MQQCNTISFSLSAAVGDEEAAASDGDGRPMPIEVHLLCTGEHTLTYESVVAFANDVAGQNASNPKEYEYGLDAAERREAQSLAEFMRYSNPYRYFSHMLWIRCRKAVPWGWLNVINEKSQGANAMQ